MGGNGTTKILFGVIGLIRCCGAFDRHCHILLCTDTISMKRIDANTTERTYKKAVKVTSTSRRVVSRDGKTLTLTNKGTDAQGKPTSSVAVYDKQ
jgi:hypothetical protein